MAKTQIIAENMRYWEADKAFREQIKEVKKRGRPKGAHVKYDFDDDPRTPFEALRVLMLIPRKEWAQSLDIHLHTLGMIERGDYVPNPSLAKAMQEEARKRGVAVTLDELYQHVIPCGSVNEVEKEETEVSE
jgi:DNA-binding XRE family transcriptional regulator